MENNRDKQTNHLLEAALSYVEKGWKIIPIHTPVKNGCSCGRHSCSSIGKHPRTKNGLKDATNEKNTINQWWKKWPTANIGILTGKESGIVVLDIDPQHGGDVSFDELVQNLGKFPDTVESFTGGGGRHIFFSYPGNGVIIRNKAGLNDYPGIDVRGDGGYVVAPPSLHKSRKRYEWEVSSNPADIPLADISSKLIKILGEKKDKLPPLDSKSKKIQEGARNNTLTSIAGSFRSKGMDFEEIFNSLKFLNEKRCDPALLETEIKEIAKSISKYSPGEFIKQKKKLRKRIEIKNRTDYGNAERLVLRHGKNIHFCFLMEKWLIWTSIKWEIDNTSEIIRLAKETVRSIYAEAAKIKDKDIREKIVKHATNSEAEPRIKAMIKLACSEYEIPVIPDLLDRDHWLLNVQNATINLNTLKIKYHCREDLITKLCPVKYDKEAVSPLWNKFLDRIMQGNKELTAFLQRAVGYSLTGDTSEQVLFIFYGTGANGKSTFLTTIGKLLGDYACQTPIDTFLIKKGDNIPNDIARLLGVRFVSAVEAEEGKRFSENLIKQLTGGDKVTARFLYKEYFEYLPTYKIFIANNHKLTIRGTDKAIWRRIRLIPFSVSIPPEEQDKNLMVRLEKELSGILNWALEGCRMWQKNGLGYPEEVEEATEGYRREMDVLAEFLEEHCIVNNAAKVQASLLYNAYKDWCEKTGEYIQNQRNMGMKLTEKGFIRKRGTRGRYYWHGIGLIDEERGELTK